MNFRRHLHGAESPLSQTTPLLNVVFLLLCLFVVGFALAPAARETGIRLPGAAGEQCPGELVVDIASNGELTVNRLALTLDELRSRLLQLSREAPESVVLVRGDPDTTFAQVLGVLDACRIAEIDKYSVVAAPGGHESPGPRTPAMP